MTEENKTGEAVRDMKGTTENKPVQDGKKQVQIHAGNIGVVQTQLLSEINVNLARIARCMEIMLRENPPKENANG